MSYEQKYLKYKTKYLSLKAQINNKSQNGGSIYGNSFENIDFLSETPSNTLNSNYKLFTSLNEYNLIGGITKSGIQSVVQSVSNTSEAQSESETQSVSNTSGTQSVAQSVSNTSEAQSESETQLDAQSVSNTSGTQSEVSQILVSKKSEEFDESEKSELGGGAKYSKLKAKSHKKFFFDDSDGDLDSTTTDSELSSLDTDSTDDSDL